MCGGKDGNTSSKVKQHLAKFAVKVEEAIDMYHHLKVFNMGYVIMILPSQALTHGIS